MSLATLALSLSSYVATLGPVVGPMAYVIFLAIWVTLCLPCSLIELVPGFLFGVPLGATVSTLGKMIGSTISLFLARYVFKDAAQTLIEKNYPIIKKLAIAVEREGFPALLLIRSAMLPIAIKNYGLAIMDVSIFHSLLAGFLTSIPHSIMWATIGAKASNLADIVAHGGSLLDELPSTEIMLLCVPLVVAGLYVVVSIVTRFQALLADDTKEFSPAPTGPVSTVNKKKPSSASKRRKGHSKSPLYNGNGHRNNTIKE